MGTFRIEFRGYNSSGRLKNIQWHTNCLLNHDMKRTKTLALTIFILLINFAYSSDKHLGEFALKQNKHWVELDENGNKKFDFEETLREDWSISLFDDSRNISVKIDLSVNKIYLVPSGGGPLQHLYNVMSPADHSVSGHHVHRVIYGAKTESAPELANAKGANGLHGYINFSITNAHELSKYNAGVGFYTTVWSLIPKPLSTFQIGLPSIWITPNNRDNNHIPLCPVGSHARDHWPERAPTYRDVFQTVEGGAGYWRSIHFKNISPKFSLNGTTQCYDYMMASPGWPSYGSNTPLPDNELGIAQLSNRMLMPPDMLTYKGSPNGEVIGYSWMSLPLYEASYLGEFVQKEGGNWIELGKNGETRFHFKETNRDEWSIYLNDASRNIKVQLDLWQEKVYWIPNDGSPKVHLYNVMDPTEKSITGHKAKRVIFAGKEVSPTKDYAPTGDNCWTIFLNTQNFKGPLCFYVPEAWSRISKVFDEPFNIGKGLDTKMASPGAGNAAMEINSVPYFTGVDKDGIEYSRIAPLYFPVDENNRSVLVRDLKVYSKDAIYNATEQWRNGGSAASGSFKNKGVTPKMKSGEVPYKHQGKQIDGVNNVVRSTVFPDANGWGIKWENSSVSPAGQFPQYFKKVGGQYVAISRKDVPTETGLLDKDFKTDTPGAPFTSENVGAWATPGASSSTYTAKLNDGSTVTYKWYRFIDQPVFQQFNFSAEKKEKIQRFVEEIHKQWTIDKEYMAPPSSGTLVSMDDGLIVTPPAGMEYGYVPIVIRQE